MKNKILSISLILFALNTSFAQDTISIEIGESAKIWMYAPNREAFKKLGSVDINRIVRDIIRKTDTLAKDKTFSYEYEYKPKIWWESDISFRKDSLPRKATYRFSSTFVNIDFGLNNYLENGKIPAGKNYSLSTVGSRYFALGIFRRWRLGNKYSPLSVHAGLEASWYNFMFERSNYITYKNNQVEFADYIADFGQSLSRNKLTVPYLNIPIMLKARFYRNGVRTFTVGLGGYLGYRLSSYSMVKPQREKKRTHESFDLNNWRYGAELQAGYGDFLFFVRYDFNNLFTNTNNNLPKLNAFAFGVRL